MPARDLSDRVVSFSYRPSNMQDVKEVDKLTDYGNKKGISRSFLILKAIRHFNKGLENGTIS